MRQGRCKRQKKVQEQGEPAEEEEEEEEEESDESEEEEDQEEEEGKKEKPEANYPFEYGDCFSRAVVLYCTRIALRPVYPYRVPVSFRM